MEITKTEENKKKNNSLQEAPVLSITKYTGKKNIEIETEAQHCGFCGFPIGKHYTSSKDEEGFIYHFFWCLSCEEYTPCGYDYQGESN